MNIFFASYMFNQSAEPKREFLKAGRLLNRLFEKYVIITNPISKRPIFKTFHVLKTSWFDIIPGLNNPRKNLHDVLRGW